MRFFPMVLVGFIVGVGLGASGITITTSPGWFFALCIPLNIFGMLLYDYLFPPKD